RVDFPLPEGPVIAQTSPAATSSVTPSSIVSGRPPLGRRMTTSRILIISDLILHWPRETTPRGRARPVVRRAAERRGGRGARGGGGGGARGQPHRRARRHRRRGVSR